MPDNENHQLNFKAVIDLVITKLQDSFNKAKEVGSAAFKQIQSVANKAYDSMGDDAKRTADVIKHAFSPSTWKDYFNAIKSGSKDITTTVQEVSKQSSVSVDQIRTKIEDLKKELKELQDYRKSVQYARDQNPNGFKGYLAPPSGSKLGYQKIDVVDNEAIRLIQEKEAELQKYQEMLRSMYGTANDMDNKRKQDILMAQNELAKLIARQKELEKEGNTWGNPEYDTNYTRIRQLKADIETYRQSLIGTDDAQQRVAASSMLLHLRV